MVMIIRYVLLALPWAWRWFSGHNLADDVCELNLQSVKVALIYLTNAVRSAGLALHPVDLSLEFY